MDKIIINNLIETNNKLVVENEDLKCMNLLLNLKIDSLQRDKELDCLKDILELNKKLLENLNYKKALIDSIINDCELNKLLLDLAKDDLFNENGELKK